MLIFENDGVIDLAAVRTLGVSVKAEGSFGFFGTGVKYGVASVLRGGGSIVLYADGKKHTFGKRVKNIRDTDFDIVTLDNKELGFTTALGRTWEPWMVLREFGCNARDEGGSFRLASEGLPLDEVAKDGRTVIAIEWDALEDAYAEKGRLFVEGEPVTETKDIRVIAGTSAHLFYRGVRAFKLEKPTAYTYDVLATQSLTEDRTLYGVWGVDRLIAAAILASTNETLLRAVLLAGDAYHEHHIDYDLWDVKPSKEFLTVCAIARENGERLPDSARKILLRHMRNVAAEEYAAGGGYRRMRDDTFSYAMTIIAELGFDIGQEGAPEIQLVVVPELVGGALSLCEGGRIFVREELREKPIEELVLELMRRVVELRAPHVTFEGGFALMAPLLLKTHPRLKRDERLNAEDDAVAAEPEQVAA